MSRFVFFISLLIVAQHVSGNHVPIIRSWRLRDVIASCWYVLWLQEGCQVRLVGSASMDVFVFLIQDALISQIYFWNKTLHVSDSSSVHHQECFTVHTAVHTGLLTACEQDQYGVPSWSCSQSVSKPVWHIPLLCVQWNTPDDGQRNCPKHVEFYSKNKFEKLVHLVGFIIRIK